MRKRFQVTVIGSDENICTEKQYRLAEEVGRALARKGCITLTGGGKGVMEAALKGAKEEGGLTVGIIPEKGLEKANKYCDVVIASGIGFARDEINVASSHGLIVVGGGAGTLNEATFAYMFKKPMVALETSGGTASKIAGQYLDVRKTEKVVSAQTPEEAVEKLLSIIVEKNKKKARG